MHVLVVDDDPEMCEVIALTMGALGIATERASCGAEALALMSKRRFDAVLSDVRMPGMNGFELAARLSWLSPLLPVFLMSGNELMPGTGPAAPNVRGLFEKPLDLATVVLRIRLAVAEMSGGTGTYQQGEST
jgi:CheY-like chemotaxis protein